MEKYVAGVELFPVLSDAQRPSWVAENLTVAASELLNSDAKGAFATLKSFRNAVISSMSFLSGCSSPSPQDLLEDPDSLEIVSQSSPNLTMFW